MGNTRPNGELEYISISVAGATQGTTTLVSSNDYRLWLRSLFLEVDDSGSGEETAKVTFGGSRDVYETDVDSAKSASIYYGDPGFPGLAGNDLQLVISGGNPKINVSGVAVRKQPGNLGITTT